MSSTQKKKIIYMYRYICIMKQATEWMRDRDKNRNKKGKSEMFCNWVGRNFDCSCKVVKMWMAWWTLWTQSDIGWWLLVAACYWFVHVFNLFCYELLFIRSFIFDEMKMKHRTKRRILSKWIKNETTNWKESKTT